MGGKPLKPKIQAYVEQRWFDEFEIYRASHNLNASRALERILAEYFGGSSELPSEELNTVATFPLVDALRAELLELRQEVEQRLQIVESKLAVESAVSMAELAHASAARLANQTTVASADSAVSLQGLANESVVDLIDLDANPVNTLTELDAGLADDSAITIDEGTIEAVDRLAKVSAVESVASEATTALDESVESADSSAIESAIIKSALAVSSLEDIVETATPANEPLEESAPAPEQGVYVASDQKTPLRCTVY